jgi:hypothetical protein
MASDQFPVGRDQHRDGPAELGHAGGNLGHLVGVMGLGFVGIRFQPGEGPKFDPVGWHHHRAGSANGVQMISVVRPGRYQLGKSSGQVTQSP